MSAAEARIPLADLPAPGQIRMLDVGGHRVGLVLVGEELHALADRCPHRGAPLCSGGRTVHGIQLGDGTPTRGGERTLLRCPWHKWDFDIASGRCVVHPTLRVRRYRVTVEQQHAVVRLQHPEREPAAGLRPVARDSRNRPMSSPG
jgi:3-phenylpropionate/trans-cinnamate dioxygenase ferredoxin subunit